MYAYLDNTLPAYHLRSLQQSYKGWFHHKKTMQNI